MATSLEGTLRIAFNSNRMAASLDCAIAAAAMTDWTWGRPAPKVSFLTAARSHESSVNRLHTIDAVRNPTDFDPASIRSRLHAAFAIADFATGDDSLARL